MTASIVGQEKITATAKLPGEIAGPAIALTVKITNGSSKVISLSDALVAVQDKAGTPFVPMSGAPSAPLAGSLPAGRAMTGVYVVALPHSYQNPITVNVSYTTGAAVVLFVGDAT